MFYIRPLRHAEKYKKSVLNDVNFMKEFFLLLISPPLAMLSQDTSRSLFCFWSLYKYAAVVFDSFLLPVLPDIVHPDSSCSNFLVSFCQAVTSPLLVG